MGPGTGIGLASTEVLVEQHALWGGPFCDVSSTIEMGHCLLGAAFLSGGCVFAVVSLNSWKARLKCKKS